MWSNSENKVKMRTISSSSTSSNHRSVLSKNSKKKSVTNEPQQSSKSKPLAKKARKHKFLSDLRRQISKNDTRDDQKMSIDDDDDQLLINLFPIHPKRSLIKESDKNNHRMKDLQHEEDHNNTVVTYNFFDTSTDCGAASLTGLLWDSIGGVDKQCSTEQQEESLSPQSLTYSFQGEASDGLDGNSLLLRTALRQRERERDSSTTEEKWVFYSEVVEKKEEEDMSTCTPDSGNHHYNNSTQISPRLSLKLDYEMIMNAWSDKGSLYIGGEGDCSSSQIVPDILDDPLTPDSTNNVTYGDAAGCMLWKVPEHHLRHDWAQSIREDHSKMMEEREARVLRYKEKRQNRLFSKRIRYQVRKLNAEKRPRMKGRFVRRS